MNSSKINDWLQIVGLFGVIASLVFVGLQMRQDREIALSEAYQDRTAISLSLDYDFRNNPALISAFAKVRNHGWSGISAEEQSLLSSFHGSTMEIYENLHYQYVHGFIDDEHWNKSEAYIRTFLLSESPRPLTMAVIEDGRVRASFASYLLALLDRMDAEPERDE